MKYKCDMIRDLMSLCADGMASDASEQAVMEHLAECESCAAEWGLLKQSVKIVPQEPVPEEIKYYHKTALRLRRHRLLTTTLTFSIASLLAWWIFTNPYSEGIRFTANQAAVAAFDYAQNHKKLNILAEPLLLEDGSRIFFMTDGEGHFYVTNVQRSPETYGLWMAYAGAKGWYRSSEDQCAGLYYFDYCSDATQMKYLIACYQENSRAEHVTLTAFGETVTKSFNENGLAVFEYSKINSELTKHFTGFASDADGNIIYELHFDKNKGYYWDSTESA